MQNLPAQSYPINPNPSSPNFLYPDVQVQQYAYNPLNVAQDPIYFAQDDRNAYYPPIEPTQTGTRAKQHPKSGDSVDGVCVKQDKQHVTRLNHAHLVYHYQRLFTVLLRFVCPKRDFLRITRIPPGPDAQAHYHYYEQICEIIYISAVFRLWRNKKHRRSTVSLGLFCESIREVIADFCLDVYGEQPAPEQLDFGDAVFIVQVMPAYLSNRDYLEHVGAANELIDRLIKKYDISMDVLYTKMYNTTKKVLY